MYMVQAASPISKDCLQHSLRYAIRLLQVGVPWWGTSTCPRNVLAPWQLEDKGEQFEREYGNAFDIWYTVVYAFFTTFISGYTGRAFPDGGRSCLAPRRQFPGGGHAYLECATG